MSKFKNLKLFNILVIALVPLLFIAMVATVTLAAMTASQEGKNTIVITGVGETTGQFVSSTGLFPGGNFVGTFSLTYAGADSNDTSTVTVSNFEITGITAHTANGDFTVANNGGAYFATGDVTSAVFDSSDDSYVLTANAAKNFTVSFAVATWNEGDGTDTTNVNPTTFLTNSVTSITIDFTFDVTATA